MLKLESALLQDLANEVDLWEEEIYTHSVEDEKKNWPENDTRSRKFFPHSIHHHFALLSPTTHIALVQRFQRMLTIATFICSVGEILGGRVGYLRRLSVFEVYVHRYLHRVIPALYHQCSIWRYPNLILAEC